MKRSILTSLAASGLLVAVLAPGASFAAGGTVYFSGTISDVTCQVDGGGGTGVGKKEVNFDTVNPADIVSGSAPERDFLINISGAQCTNDTKVRLQFDAHHHNIDQVTGNLKLAGEGSADGVQIQIRNNRTEAPANTDPIRLGFPDTNQQVAEVKNNQAVLYYSAKYVPEDPTATTVGSGTGASYVTYTLRYN